MIRQAQTEQIRITTKYQDLGTRIKSDVSSAIEEIVKREGGSQAFSDSRRTGFRESTEHTTYWLPGGAIEYRCAVQEPGERGWMDPATSYRLALRITVTSTTQDYSRLRQEIEGRARSRFEETVQITD